MNIYLDESYNFQKTKGKMFLSISGFAVLDEKGIRKRWRSIRRPYVKSKRRIHATDSEFEGLRQKSIKMLAYSDVTILSIFQSMHYMSHAYFVENGVKFDLLYADLLKKLFEEAHLEKYHRARIVLDARKHKGGASAEKEFKKDIENWLKIKFPHTQCALQMVPSYVDVLVELADFLSNSFYKEYQGGTECISGQLSRRLTQIKNPL